MGVGGKYVVDVEVVKMLAHDVLRIVAERRMINKTCMRTSLPGSFPLVFLLALILSLPLSGQPDIAVSDEQLPGFREVYTGHFSDVQFYYVSADNLNAPLVLLSEEPFRISLECYQGFTDSLALVPDDGAISTTRIYVRLFPETPGDFQKIIFHYSAGVEAVELLVSGTGIVTSIPDGYYDTAYGSGSALKSQLHQIISGHQVQSYASLWSHFTATDATFDAYVWDIYSDTPCEEPPYIYSFGDDQDTGTGGTQEGEVYNREHSMPRSWFGGAVDPMNTDLYHIYPVDKFVNAQRANYPFGEVDAPEWTSMNGGKLGPNVAGGYDGTAFEPIDEYKGDLARAFFYMITRYENQIEHWTYSEYGNAMFDHNTYPGYESWAIDMLMAWHESDPVSQKELLRNQAVYQIQGNRNPFVDHPEWVEKIWGDTTVHAGPGPAGDRVRMYPNPASHQVQIETEHDILQLKIYSAAGNLLGHSGPHIKTVSMCLQKRPSGLYIIHITTPEGVFRHKLIIK